MVLRWRSLSISIFFFFLESSLLAAAPAIKKEVISTAVGIVQGRAVTSREVQIGNQIETALYEKSPTNAARAPLLDTNSRSFAKAVQGALLEIAISLEAQSLNLVKISPSEVQVAEKTVLKVMKHSSAWKTLKVSPKELAEAVTRKLRAKKFIQFRFDSSMFVATDSEVQRYFEENREKFGEMSFQNSKENIKSLLSKRQVEKRLQDWFEILLSKYQVKNLITES